MDHEHQGAKYNAEFDVWVYADGRIFRGEKELKPSIGHWGYRRVNALPGRTVYIHRLVAQAFVGGYEEGLVVHHKNHDVSDNSAENLEWVTRGYNSSTQRITVSPPKRPMSTVILRHATDEVDALREILKAQGYSTVVAWFREIVRKELAKNI